MNVLLLSSTYQSMSEVKIPMFVLDQTVNIVDKGGCSFHVLAPHDAKLKTRSNHVNSDIKVTYFHYFFFHKLESLNYEGVWPAIKHHPFKLLLLPFLILMFLVNALAIAFRERPDAIYAHWFTPQAVVAYIVSRVCGIPFYYTSHSSDVWLLKKIPILGRAVVREVTRRAAGITVVSQRTERKLRSFYSDEEWHRIRRKVKIIPMGVYSEGATEVKKRSGKDIIFVGRLAEKKGLQYLIPAFDRFVAEFPDYRLLVAGVGPFKQEVEDIVAEMIHKENIQLLGYVGGEDKIELIRNGVCVVVPSIVTDSGDAEGLPVSLLEGLSQGMPCIATNESGADDILIDGHNGLLIDQKSEDLIYQALVRVSGMTQTELNEMGREAKRTASQFDWGLIAARYKAFLEGALFEEGSDT